MPRQMRWLEGLHDPREPAVESVDASMARPQGYRLEISPPRIRLIGHDAAGLFYARQTLTQLRRLFGQRLPCCRIEDWPDFPNRGVMLDVSRDKVPTMATLRSLIDRLAEWKINQLQLYIEHTFAYAGHEEVWRDASPLTPEQIRELDRCCADRFIELVPNQNSFGHMERWLKHERYKPLAEAPDGAQTPWGFWWDGPFSLCPTDPRSLELLSDLYAQLLANFTSKQFNVGCDETFDIGQGRSRAECQRIGVTGVYLEFLSKLRDRVHRHGRRMMFWGDIVVRHPEMAPRLPQDLIALLWGYEADHPFDSEAATLAASGIPFYVCPGTSSWCSIAGRTSNMLENQIRAARAGLKHGAGGILNTDWGDYGHLQYLPFSYPGLAAGAAMAWCGQSNHDLPLADALDWHALRPRNEPREKSGARFGASICALGEVYQAIGKPTANRSALFGLLVPESVRVGDAMDGITRQGLEAAQAAIAAAVNGISQAGSNTADDLLRRELLAAAAMLRHACRKGLWRLDGSPRRAAADLRDELSAIIHDHESLWLARNRPGGLKDSAARLAANFSEYKE